MSSWRTQRIIGGVAQAACLALGGCHLFEGLSIDCTAELPCAKGVDDTGGDTGGPGPESGWIVSQAADGYGRVVAYGPDGAVLKQWDDLLAVIDYPGDVSALAGSVFYNPGTGSGLVGYGSTLAVLGSDGNTTVSLLYGAAEIYDVDGVAGKAWYSSGDAVYAYPLDQATGHTISPAGLSKVYGLAVIGENVVFTDAADAPDLYVFSTTTDARVSADYDITDNAGRAANVFGGPDGEIYSCSDAGAIYNVSQLATSTAYVAIVPDDLHDVTDCGWDPGDGSWLVFSQSMGVYRITTDGTASVVWPIPDEYAGKRASFFH
jgi:hypothetical protein